jgi:hypothetical protein
VFQFSFISWNGFIRHRGLQFPSLPTAFPPPPRIFPIPPITSHTRTPLFCGQDRPSPEALIVQHCRRKYGVASRPGWIPSTSDFGSGPSGASNIVFSNGDLDPWSSGGVRTNLSSSVLSFTVKDGAHHLDLMWSNPSDGQSVRDVRNAQLSQVRRWVAEAAARRE